MRRLLFFLGVAAGVFLAWYYLTNLRERKAQLAHSTQRIVLSSRSAPPPPEPVAETSIQVEAYCVKCKTRRVMQSPYATTTQTGRPAIRGTCPVCGAKLFKMGQM